MSPLRVCRFDTWIDPVFDRLLSNSPAVTLERLRHADPDDRNLERLEVADVLQISAARDEVPARWRVDEALLARCPALLCVSSGGAGFDTVDVDACTRRGIAVVNQAGGNARSVAEHTMALLLALTHRIAESDRRLRGLHGVHGFAREDLMGSEIAGRTLGLVGIGHIGTRVARLAAAFEMTVVACDPLLTGDEIRARGAEPLALADLLPRADVVSLHCPRDASTLGMIGAAAFARMKAGAFFLSTARGGIHDENALLLALESGHLAGAGLDVWEVEPPPVDHPLLGRADVVATYHTAGVTRDARHAVAAMAAQQILDFADGRRPPRLVDPRAWPACRDRLASRLGRPVDDDPATRDTP